MPRVREYTTEVSPQGGLGVRNATASDFGSDSGTRIGEGVQRYAAVLQEKAAQDDVTNVRVQLAKARAEWDVHFRDRSLASQPGDPNFAEKFGQDFSDYLDKTRDIAQTREGQRTFDVLAADLKGHFGEKAGLFQIASAGVKAKLDWTESQRAYATSVGTDPTSYSSVLKQAMDELRDPNGQYSRIDMNTKQQLEASARNTLAQSYVFGLQNMKGNGPALALKTLEDGKLDDQLDPTAKQRLIRSSEQAINAQRVAEEHAAALAAKEAKERQQQTNDGLMGKFVAGKLTMDDVRGAGLPAFGDGSQATWISMLRQQTKDLTEKPVRTNPNVYNAVRERIDLPFGDPKRITDRDDIWREYVNRNISEADANRLERRFVDARSESGQRWAQAESEFIHNVVKPQLDKSTMLKIDMEGGARVQSFSVFMRDKADEYRKANKDPYALLKPDSPEYIGKFIPRFQSGAQRTQADLANKVDAALGKSTPRPSLDDIFKPK